MHVITSIAYACMDLYILCIPVQKNNNFSCIHIIIHVVLQIHIGTQNVCTCEILVFHGSV